MFGLNNAQLIGRLGADATISHLTNGGRVANVSIATDESYLDKNSGRQGGPHRVAPHRHLPGRPGGDAGEARQEGPPGLRVGQAADPQVAQGRRGQRPVLDRDPPGPRRQSPVLGQAERKRRTGEERRRPCLPPRPPRRWMTAKFLSSGLPPSRITQGQSPPSRHGAWPFFFAESRSVPGATNAPKPLTARACRGFALRASAAQTSARVQRRA